MLLSDQLQFSSGVSEREVYVNMSEVQYLTNKVMSGIETSLLKELDLSNLHEEHLVSKQTEESCLRKEILLEQNAHLVKNNNFLKLKKLGSLFL
ncbi:hypothetical protein NPIL_436451 [Nephila pilipes]|uniref:Uncharacterized protein n=1 Tax=Nephila pilipes TaxID=299642 RepID=A0A8X6TWI4_NEPPI|nr:hypothetical protein NPIL_436451 [Nephila pilipes]